ncbi:MAG: PQQ-binding-like beta-propeller repeat protein [Rickettsiaceae bacterium]|nr:PQQ-binding-like beta-propeller repeat protein [Rickettsiaceae bacterium]
MQNIIFLFFFFLLEACSGTQKINSIVDFTTILMPNSKKEITLSETLEDDNFGNHFVYVSNGYIQKINDITNFEVKKLPFGSDSFSAMPFVRGGKLYAAFKNGNVKCFDLASQKTDWVVKIDNINKSIVTSTLVASNDYVIVTYNTSLYKISAQTGNILNKYSLPDLVKQYPVIRGDKLYIKTANNNLYAYDLNSLRELWNYKTWSEYISTNSDKAPVIIGNQLISGFTTGQIISFESETGREFWQIDILKQAKTKLGSEPADFTCQPAIFGQYLYVATSGSIVKIDARIPLEEWSVEASDIISMTTAGDLFVINNRGQIAAISHEDGSVIWATNLLEAQKSRTYSPAIFTPPLVTRSKIFAFSDEGYGYAIDTQNGEVVKKFSIPKNIKSFCISAGKIILFNNKGAYILN